MSALAEDVLNLLEKREKVTIREIKDKFDVTEETAQMIINFLMEFGFAEADKSKKYYMLSNACKKFFKELGS